MSVRRQCELLGLNRSSFYAEPALASPDDLAMMERLDRWHLEHPELGSRKLAVLMSSPGEAVNRKRVQRLMRVMGLECLFPRPRCTVTTRCHHKYPYLLWRIVKYEELYPKRYATVPELEAGLTAYFEYYNEVRPHQSLKYRTPASVHAGG